MVLKGAYFQKPADAGKNYFWEQDVEAVLNDKGVATSWKLRSDGSPVEYEMTTMSKSKNNGIDPQALIDRYGADTARLFVMFASPPEQTLEWNDAGVEGAHRFLKRVWGFGAKNADLLSAAGASFADLAAPAKALRREVHVLLKQVTYDYERMQYNTVVSGAMKLLNALEGFAVDGSKGSAAVLREGFSVLLRALYPACPHITQGLWTDLGYAAQGKQLLDAGWPAVDDAALVQDELELVLQVLGKTRGQRARARERRQGRHRGARARIARGAALDGGQAGEEGRRRAGSPRQHRRLMNSRRLALATLAFAAAATLAACGFHRRIAQPLNYERIALSGFADRSTMADEIRRALPSTAHIVSNVLESQVVIEAVEDTQKTTVEASTAFGQVRELELHVKLRYRVLDPNGTELLPLADVERFRDLTYDEQNALAKDSELKSLYRDMQSDMAFQLVRVLSAVGKPTGPAAQAQAARAASAAVAASGASSVSAVEWAASQAAGR